MATLWPHLKRATELLKTQFDVLFNRVTKTKTLANFHREYKRDRFSMAPTAEVACYLRDYNIKTFSAYARSPLRG